MGTHILNELADHIAAPAVTPAVHILNSIDTAVFMGRGNHRAMPQFGNALLPAAVRNPIRHSILGQLPIHEGVRQLGLTVTV